MAMPSDPANAGRVPTRFACGVPATARANGQCFDNDRSEIQSPPPPYEGGPPDQAPAFGVEDEPEPRWDDSLRAADCVEEASGLIRNTCGRSIVIAGHCTAIPLGGPAPIKIQGREFYDGVHFSPEGRVLGPGQTRQISALTGFVCGGDDARWVFIACYGTEYGEFTGVVPGWQSSSSEGPYSCWVRSEDSGGADRPG